MWSAYALNDETHSTPLHSAQGDTLFKCHFSSGAVAKSKNPISRNEQLYKVYTNTIFKVCRGMQN